MATQAELEVIIKARDQASRALRSLGQKFQNLGKTIGRAIGMAAKLAAVGVAAAGIAAVKMAADFETSFAEVTTLFDAPASQVEALRLGVLDLASTLGVDAVEATKGLYQTISAGIPRENALSFLEVASKAAIAGVTDLSTAVDGLTTVMNAYKLPAEDAGRVSDVLFTAVKLGKTTMEELSTSMFLAAPLAAALGVDIEQVAAATATLTKSGAPTSVAMTQIRSAMVALQKTTPAMEDALENLGFATGDALLQAEGFQGAMVLLRAEAERMGIPLIELFGRVEGLQAALGLTGDSAQTAADDLAAMRDSAGATDAAFEKMNETFGRQFEILQSQLKVAMIEIGGEILPSVTRAAQAFGDWFRENRETIMGTLRVWGEGFQMVADAAIEFGGWIIKNKPVLIAAIIAIGAAFIWVSPLIALFVGAGGLIFALGLLGATAEDLPLPLLKLRVEIRKFILALLESVHFALTLINALTTLGFLDKGLADGAVKDLEEAIFSQEQALADDIDILRDMERELIIAETPLVDITDKFLEQAVAAGLTAEQIRQFDDDLDTAKRTGNAFSLLTPKQQVQTLGDRFFITDEEAVGLLTTWQLMEDKKLAIGGALGEVGEAVAALGRKYGITTKQATDLFLALTGFGTVSGPGGPVTIGDIGNAIQSIPGSGSALAFGAGGVSAFGMGSVSAFGGGGNVIVNFTGAISLSGGATQDDAEEFADMVDHALRNRTARR